MLPAQSVACPYCGEPIVLLLDDSAGASEYVEDCPVCCRPITVALVLGADGMPSAQVRREQDA